GFCRPPAVSCAPHPPQMLMSSPKPKQPTDEPQTPQEPGEDDLYKPFDDGSTIHSELRQFQTISCSGTMYKSLSLSLMHTLPPCVDDDPSSWSSTTPVATHSSRIDGGLFAY